VFLLFCAAIPASAQAADLVLNEIMYNPLGGSDYEFIELWNRGSVTVDLNGYRFSDGIDYTFTNPYSLPAGAYLVFAGDAAAFAVRYPSVTNVAPGSYGGKLANEGERVTFENAYGTTVYTVRYGDSGFWPEWADGHGASLNLLNPDADPDDSLNWAASDLLHGSPGVSNVPAIRDLVINEVISHTDPPLEDAIEICNRGASAVDISGWYLSDDVEQRKKYRITNGVIAAGGYVVFYENQFNNTSDPQPNDVAFSFDSALGDLAYLTGADGSGNLTLRSR